MENRDAMRAVLGYYTGDRSPEGLTKFYNLLRSESRDPNDLIRAFLDIENWETSSGTNLAAVTCANMLLDRILPHAEDDYLQRPDPSSLLVEGVDIPLVRAAVIMGKTICYKEKNEFNVGTMFNDIRSIARGIDESTATVEIKLTAMDLYHQLQEWLYQPGPR